MKQHQDGNSEGEMRERARKAPTPSRAAQLGEGTRPIHLENGLDGGQERGCVPSWTGSSTYMKFSRRGHNEQGLVLCPHLAMVYIFRSRPSQMQTTTHGLVTVFDRTGDGGCYLSCLLHILDQYRCLYRSRRESNLRQRLSVHTKYGQYV